MNPQQKIKTDSSMFAPVKTGKGYIEIEVEFLGRKGSYFTVYFEDIDKATEKEYKRILNGNFKGMKLKQKNLDDAVRYLFDKKFVETNIDWNDYKTDGTGEQTDEIISNRLESAGYASEKDYFLRDATGQRYVRPSVDKYFEVVMPDADYTKD